MGDHLQNLSLHTVDLTDNDLNVFFIDSPCEHYEQQPYWEPKIENISECQRNHGEDDECSSCQAYFDQSHQTVIHIQQQDVNTSDEPFCNCQKTGCVKLYCSCFRKGLECNEQCICCECHNHSGDKVLVVAKDRIVTLYHQEPGFDNFHGCNCKKSKCKQNYCECLIRGLRCGDDCKCKKCENGKIYVKVIRKRNKTLLSC